MTKILAGQYNFNEKLKWNPAYIEAPGTGPDATACRRCVHFGHDIDAEGGGDNLKHFYFCGQVLKSVGIAKGINKDTASCRQYEERKRGVPSLTTRKL